MKTTNCAECGRLVKQKRRGRPALYCSDACRQRAHRGVKDRPQRYCSFCGQRLPKAARPNQRYCNPTCRLSHRTKKEQAERRKADDSEA